MDYTVDLLIFGISSKESTNIRELGKKNLSIILVNRDKEPFKGKLVLPGGYIDKKETSLEAANRVLEKETGLKNIQLYLSNINDDIKRDPRNRTVSVSYIALVDVEKIDQELKNGSKWYDINYYFNDDSIDINLSNDLDSFFFSVNREIVDAKTNLEHYSTKNNKLGFDHDIILTKGIMDLRYKVQNTDIIFNLLPDKFTIGSLEQIYGNILKEPVVNSAFRRTFADKLEITKDMVKTGGHRPSYLYKYKEKNNSINKTKGELVDVYDPNTLEKTNDVIYKDSAHALGVWHCAVHLLIINKDKTKTLFQLRSKQKKLLPNIWDIAVGGHVSAGETDVIAMKRELSEELGLNPDKYKLEFIKRIKEEFVYKDINNKEIVSLFVLQLDKDLEKLHLQKEEVSSTRWLTKTEFELMLKNKQIVNHIEQYNYLREILK